MPETFSSFDLNASLQSTLLNLGWINATPIQAAVLALGIPSEQDIIALAETGSGKTAAFLLPILHALQLPAFASAYALILAPTHELAQQTAEVANALVPGSAASFIGGDGQGAQAAAAYLRLTPRPRILVGTAGRVNEILGGTLGQMILPDLRFLVVDEADRCVQIDEINFSEVVSAVRIAETEARNVAMRLNKATKVKLLPPPTRTWLFSATCRDAEELARRVGMKAYRLVVPSTTDALAPGSTPRLPPALAQTVAVVPAADRLLYLVAVISQLLGAPPAAANTALAGRPERLHGREIEDAKRSVITAQAIQMKLNKKDGFKKRKLIVFCNTQRDVTRISRVLRVLGFSASGLHGGLQQRDREINLAEFILKNDILVVTGELAGRGLDLSDVQFVVNYDLPLKPEEYAHRVGRTARAGDAGKAVSLCTLQAAGTLRAIEEHFGLHLGVEDVLGRTLSSWRQGLVAAVAAVDGSLKKEDKDHASKKKMVRAKSKVSKFNL